MFKLSYAVFFALVLTFASGLNLCAALSAQAQTTDPYTNYLLGQARGQVRGAQDDMRRVRRTVPVEHTLDYKCSHGDYRACRIRQKQINDANIVMCQRWGRC